jgi:hypothetical protein
MGYSGDNFCLFRALYETGEKPPYRKFSDRNLIRRTVLSLKLNGA